MTALVIAALAATALVATALAVAPKKGVELAGETSFPGPERIFLKVSSSGKTLNMSIPSIDGAIPPRIKNVKISDTGKFSATREPSTSGGFHGDRQWKIKISGRFTAATKAQGTFSAEAADDRGENGSTYSSHGKQTFSLKFYK